MYGVTPIILIILPLIFQIIYGRKAIGEDIKWPFGTVCIISFLSQIILSFVSFSIAVYNFNKTFKENEFRCGTGLVAFAFLIFIFTIFLLITMIVQYFIKRSYKKNT